MSERVGVLGGTFDPIHNGHLAIAEEARVALGLAQVLLVPAGKQPLKDGQHVATAQQRLEMVRLACADNPGFAVSTLEVERPGLSYTVETLDELNRTGVGELHFILGADSLADLPRWREAARIVTLARIVAVERPGHRLDPNALYERLPGLVGRLTTLEGPQLEIASRDLRRRVAENRPIRYQTPDVVVEYIREQGLYR
jgi:nicotinate-nucleotide adenylyltransferase